MTHDDLQSLLGAYALGALEADELASVEDHLAECPRCRSEVAAHRDTVSLLANDGGEAPAQVWDRIAGELGFDDPPPKVVALPRRRRVALPIVTALASVAAAAAGVLGVSAAHLDHRVNVLSGAVSAGGLQQAAAAAVLNPQHRAVQLVSATSHQRAQIVILPGGSAYLVGSNLPALDSQWTYQLWALSNGRSVSLGLLGPDPRLAAFHVDQGESRLMVTAEPRGGVAQPTTPALVQGNLPKI